MFKYFVMQEAGIDIYPLISLSAFVIFFVILIVLTIKYKKAFIEEASRIPLEDERDRAYENYDLKK